MRLTLFVLLIASFALSGCISRPLPFLQPPKQTTLSADRVELPTTFIKRMPYVELKINGKGPYLFLVDTGAVGMAVSPRVVREAGILFSRKHTTNIGGAGGHHERLHWVKVDRVEAPLFSLSKVGAVMLGAGYADAIERHVANNFGGIIGMAALQDVLLEIDYPKCQVSVARLGSTILAAESGLPYKGVSPVVTIATPSAKHATTTALVDTGADSYFDIADIVSYPLRVGLIKSDGYHQSIGGYWRPLFGQLAGDIRLGTAIWRDPMIYSANKNRIGSEAFAPWKLVIDQKKKMLWLLDENQISTTICTGPFDPDGRGAVFGFVWVEKGDSFVVKEVDPGSRAERAGLKVGDVILPENKEAIALEHTRKKDPYLARLRIARGDERFEITMSLADPLPAPAEPAAAAKSDGEPK